MKKFYSALFCMALSVGSAYGDAQIPNSGFEEEWATLVPWTFYVDSESGDVMSNTHSSTTDISGALVELKTPQGWVVSDVAGMVTAEGALGMTKVGFNVEGYESNSAVSLVNSPNPFMAAQIVPAYINLGTAWSTAMPAFSMAGIEIKNADGGAWGGMPFTERPKSLKFMYKRSRAEAPEDDKENKTYNPDEASTIVAYLWKGHWTQKDVPVSIDMVGEPVKKDMVDRDRCVLGMSLEGCQGGEVSKTNDAELIGVLKANITEDASEWTEFSADFEYFSDATPEYINIILASGDYFGGSAVVGRDNSLTVDNVQLVYEASAKDYPGYLNVSMAGSEITKDQESKIVITPTEEGKCSFLLPNLVLDIEGNPLALGDIKLDDVTVVKTDGEETYTGLAKGMKLLGGVIVADVALTGTIKDGVVDMTIDVMWEDMPISVTFTTEKTAGIGMTEWNEDIAPRYFDLRGLSVDADNLTPGIYVKKQGRKVVKVLVK